jgi:RNA polymerase sigma-70 factor, ECF subfamily
MNNVNIESEPTQCLTDSDLVRAIRSGDRLALEHLYLRYYPRLERLLAMFMGNRHKIEDVINETFLTVWTRAKDFQPGSAVSTWVVGVACRLAMQSSRGESPASSEQHPEKRCTEMTDPVRALGLGNRLTSALIHLPVEQRMTLCLAYQQGLSVEEISEATQSTVETVQLRMSLARIQMRDAVAEAWRRVEHGE